MQSIVQKLPNNLQTKRRETVVKGRRKNGKIAGFEDLTKFVEYAAESANDPIYSRDALSNAKSKAGLPSSFTNYNQKLPTSRPKSTSFATNLEAPTQSPSSHGAGYSRQDAAASRCSLCHKSHDLEECEDFRKKSVDQRKSFLTVKFLCFGCYGENYLSRSCRKKRVRKKCKGPHPTLLHEDGFSLKKENGNGDFNVKNASEKTVRVSNACTDIPQDSNEVTVLQTILPVLITDKNTNKTVKNYAFSDNGSGGCFLTERLRERLEVPGTKTSLQLGTMHGQSLVESTVVEDLVIPDLNGEYPIELPRAYTRDEIPVELDQIPTSEIVRHLDHLEDIASEIPAYDSSIDIGLLIGSNCPAALAPLSVVPYEGDGPYAVKLKHSWTVSGPLHVIMESATNKVTVNRITVREVQTVKEIITPKSLLQLFELDFSEKASSNHPEDFGHSHEYRRFLSKVSNDIIHAEGHYAIPLPFRQSEAKLPNNRQQALKRALWQRKKMLQSERYRNDYVAFITEMIDKGYAEKVPRESLQIVSGKAWYIPHHGVYHPKKPEKIRVVFDCSAKSAGTSLNDQLLQGPDLTNSLAGVLTRFRQEPVAFMADIEAMFYQVRVPAYQRISYDFCGGQVEI